MPNLTGLPDSRGGLLGDAPDLGVFERVLRIVLDLADHPRPAPGLVDRIQHGTDWIGKQGRTRRRSLQFLMLETFPALEHVMMPRAAGHILVEVIIAGRKDIQAGPGLVGNDHGMGIGELFAEPGIHHGRIQRPTPGVQAVPAWARPRAGYSCGKHQVFGCSECHSCRDLCLITQNHGSHPGHGLPADEPGCGPNLPQVSQSTTGFRAGSLVERNADMACMAVELVPSQAGSYNG